MNKKEKLQRIEKIHKIISNTGLMMTISSFLPQVKNDKKLKLTLLAAGGLCSISSFVTYVQSLEQYGLYKDVDESEIMKEYLKNVVIMPTLDVIMMANSLKDTIKNN